MCKFIAINPFTENVLGDWDGHIYMRTVKNKPKNRALTQPLPCGDGFVPINFEWDGSSVPWFFQRVFPRHNHPIASCRHDFRCRLAKNDEERKFADKEFKKDVGRTSWKITANIGYIGVRIGAFFGIGSDFK
jgi:hypothetical protein